MGEEGGVGVVLGHGVGCEAGVVTEPRPHPGLPHRAGRAPVGGVGGVGNASSSLAAIF